MIFLNYAICAVSKYARKYLAYYIRVLLGQLCGKYTCPGVLAKKHECTQIMQPKTHEQPHECNWCRMAKHTSAFHAKQMHTYYLHKNDSHDRKIASRVYMHALDMHFTTSIFLAYAANIANCFQKCIGPCSCRTNVQSSLN